MSEEGLGVLLNCEYAYAWLSLTATEGMPDVVQARD